VADWDSVPDVEKFTARLRESLDELYALSH
jgi:hypothetical protein